MEFDVPNLWHAMALGRSIAALTPLRKIIGRAKEVGGKQREGNCNLGLGLMAYKMLFVIITPLTASQKQAPRSLIK